ncbi:hypothetical protein EAI_07147 [Harpegnathos saltator]|uniref:Uncharacterized protein n=1 Tax=Harpegnathos saltator TaxID=610380 RepID=E2C607_HARSA|nr:hypothetical protein EAI_07147 [Harpegnathos saltator]
MVLSDLDQIKKNERDRRRRLRLEQVRQQSKEISNRLLERAKKIAREELNKLEKDAKSELRQMHDKKIMEIQEKCQEDLEDIGQAHACAALQPDIDAIREEEGRRDRAMAIKRGKDAAQHMREIKQKDSTEVTHQERLRKVREEENIRAATIAKLPKPTTILEDNSNSKINSSTEDSNEEVICERLTPNKKSNKVLPKKSPKKTKKSSSKEYQKTLSPKPGPSGLQKQFRRMASKKKTIDTDRIEHIIDNAIDEHQPRRTVPVISTTPAKADKITRYNPEDYTQDTSDTSSISSSGSSSVSDDSSYFSDGAEQVSYRKDAKTAVLTGSKVRLYDHDTRQRNVYNTPLGIVERIDIGNEPSAIEAAQAMKDVEDAKAHTVMCRKLTAQRRGQDAILREKVRRDYQALIKNLEHLTQEERKLKASQIHSNAVEKTTSPAQRKDEICSDVPNSTWQEPYLDKEEITVCHTQDQDSEVSREEQILDMLKKVERQKRLLLKEFGASLPDNIFNASVKPLFGDRTPAPATAQVADTAKLSSPEITVINMSNYNECAKKDRKVKKKPESLSTKKIEIAIQTSLDRISPAEDKSIQVELPQENVDIPHSSTYKDVGIGQASHPIEPQVTVITPETDDSSNDSTSSDITGMIIEIDKKEVTVTPKKRKSNLKVSKRPSPRVYQKIRSTSVSSKATSPMKRFSRSHSSSRLTSPQKRTKCTDAPDTASRRVDIHVSKSEFNDETDPSQETRVSIDASAESSQTFSGVNDQDGSTGKPYRIRTQVKKWIRIKDTSDTTSTSFASPPPVKPRSMLDALTNITPILEMLDSSRTEELRRLRQDISPVSTPETPSPRTMRMPSNIPHRDKISRMLRYNSNNSQNNNSVTLSSTQNDQTLSTDPSDPQEAATSKCESASLQQPSVSSKVCICKNPKCKLLHIKLDDIHDYALKNCPEILQKYEDLQNLCAERIASLTDLIERVRSEQKDMDFSLISPSDETSLMQLPTSKPVRSDVQAIRKLIESIEAIHSQLAKTLFESQKIIENGATSDNEISRDAEVQVTTSTPRSKSIDTITAPIQKSEVAKAKPKVISDEKVNIQLNRFKIQQKPQAVPAIKTPERNSWPPCAVSLHEEEVIEKLSKEILEQSKSLDKASTAFVSLKENDEISMQRKGSLSNDAILKNNLLEHKKDNSIINLVQEVTKENDFTPILVAIPKVARAHGTVTSISARPKPPVTLLNAPHWQELESSGHELSTIVEFDTTDTVNKSIKSPTKSKNMAVDTVEDLQNILLKGTIDAESKSAITVKPSVHVAPLSVQQDQNIPVQIADSTTDMKHFVDLISAQRSQEATTIYDSPGKSKNATDCIASMKTEAERDWVDCTLENSNKQLQCNTITEDPILQAKDILALGSSIKLLKYASSPEEMETALKKLGLSWAVTTLKKTREASALSSSSNSDVTPINTARRMISPTKKHLDPSGLPDISDVSSISIKEANKSTEQAVLMKGRTSTPKFQNSNSNSERSSTTNTSGSLQEPSDSLTVPNVSLTKIKSDNKQLQNL